MCGRFALNATAADLVSFFGIHLPPGVPDALVATEQGLLPPLPPRYNIAPSQEVAVVRAALGEGGPAPRLDLLHWGLVPAWSRGEWKEIRKQSYRMLNARAETAFEKPSFRKAIASRRCLIPTNGFYEWGDPPGWRKGQPKPATLIHRPDRGLLAMGGIWERWQGPEGVVQSVAILTTAANATVAPLHDRMPVLVPEEAFSLWLDPGMQAREVVEPLLAPASEGLLVLSRVGPAVNDARQDTVACWDPA